MLIDESIDNMIKNLPPIYYKIMKRYSEGINYYLKHNRLAPEFLILRYKPGRWSVKDSIAIFKNMEIYLQSSGSELYNYKLVKA